MTLCVTRPGRNGEAGAKWANEIAQKRTDAKFELVDINDFNLPLLDEPAPPAMGQYSKPHTNNQRERITRIRFLSLWREALLSSLRFCSSDGPTKKVTTISAIVSESKLWPVLPNTSANTAKSGKALRHGSTPLSSMTTSASEAKPDPCTLTKPQ
ncbi:MAG: NADPH-dependent oxidoreductase [Verrucomicrobiales bacterium]|nr:NADPH-dependent oxidoreductase [Verrucomicrobiales bacterium]